MSGKTRPLRSGYVGAALTMVLAGLVLASMVSGVGSPSGGGAVETVKRPSAIPIQPPEPPRPAEAREPVEVSSVEATPKVECENLLLEVDADHTLSPDYVPPDLVYLSAYGIAARGAEDMLRQEAAGQLVGLLSAAAADGEELLVASGYRSYREQAGTFAWFKEAYGEEAGRLSVPPGQSEHQLGTAVDFTSSDVNYELLPAFSQTSAGEWLAEHASRFGFFLSYAEHREPHTGVRFEPWHYRYVGVANARKAESSEDGTPDLLYREGLPNCYKP